MLWTDLFPPPSPNESTAAAVPRLGIDYVQASALEAAIPIFSSSSSDVGQSATPSTMVIQQSLSQHGIAGVVWNCARALIFYLQRQPYLLAKKRVLELGAGTGAVGLTLAVSGCDLKSLILTDLEGVVPLTAQNMRSAASKHVQICTMLDRNALSTLPYCWGDAVSESLSEDMDVILCSDCLYEPSQYANLLASLVVLTGRHEDKEGGEQTPVVLIAYKQRMPAREKTFFESASECFDIAIDAVDGHACSAVGGDIIYICRLERRSCDPHQAS